MKEIREIQCKIFFVVILYNVFVEGISSLKPSEKLYCLKLTQILIDTFTTDYVSLMKITD